MFLPLDRAKRLAWAEYKRALCDGCRTRESDWRDDDGEPLDKPRVKFDTRRWVCPGCEKLHIFRERVKAEVGDDVKQLVGLDFVTVSNNGAP